MKILSLEILTELSLVFALVGGVATTQYVLLEHSLSQDIESVEIKREADQKSVEHRLDSIDSKIENLENRMERVENRMERVEDKIDRLIVHLLEKPPREIFKWSYFLLKS